MAAPAKPGSIIWGMLRFSHLCTDDQNQFNKKYHGHDNYQGHYKYRGLDIEWPEQPVQEHAKCRGLFHPKTEERMLELL